MPPLNVFGGALNSALNKKNHKFNLPYKKRVKQRCVQTETFGVNVLKAK